MQISTEDDDDDDDDDTFSIFCLRFAGYFYIHRVQICFGIKF